MPNEVAAFVKEALARGLSREAIRGQLLKAGWHEDEVRNALAAYLDTDFPIPVPRRKPYLSAREAFYYLVMFSMLYVSAISYGTLLFQFVERWLPDASQDLSYVRPVEVIRNATAALIIAYPIFLAIARVLTRAVERDKEKRGSRIRKWLTYVTLLIAAGVIVGALITLLRSVLAGELTARFILKSLSVLAISGTIFGYYLWDLRQEEKEDA
jgi:hypothetical protein